MIQYEYVAERYVTKTRLNGPPVSGDDIILYSVMLTQCRRVPDGQTDRRIEMLQLRQRSAIEAPRCNNRWQNKLQNESDEHIKKSSKQSESLWNEAVNPLQRSGVRWLHFEVFSVIQI